ncbi:MAG: alkaline phosphatase family protein [Phycisphaeraceae bacterium]
MRNSEQQVNNDQVDNKVLVVAFDCAEKTLIERWMNEGRLPNLKSLYERGAYGKLDSTAGELVATPWPTVVTSQWPVEHGFICWMQWRPELMDEQRADETWVKLNPFYRRLGPLGKRVIAVDVPMADRPEPFDGLEVVSWGSYDKLSELSSHPPELVERLARQYHRLPMGPELGESEPVRAKLRLRDQMVHGTQRVGEACADLCRQEEWDLFLVGFGATHRAGHNLWNHAAFTEAQPDPKLAAEYDQALCRVYEAVDRELGRLLKAISDHTAVCVLATHGVRDSTSRFELLPEMLNRILHDRYVSAEEARPSKPKLLKRIRRAIPVTWRSRIKRSLPKHVQDALTKFWQGKGHRDWSTIRAFVPTGDLEGYVRVNLKGRERDGVVAPDEFEPLLAKITEGLRSWKDRATGEPIVAEVVRGADLWPEVPAEQRHPSMPDLIVKWSDRPTIQTPVMVSEQYGELHWPVPNKHPDGRSGHHQSTGWMVAAGEGIEPGARFEAHGIDLAPTWMAMLGLKPFEEMRGHPIEALRPSSESATISG